MQIYNLSYIGRAIQFMNLEDRQPIIRKQKSLHRRPLVVQRGIYVGIIIYAALSMLANITAWIHGASHTLAGGLGGDGGQEVWFLAAAAHSIAHLENPLMSTWINVPTGVNLADMTSMPLAGIVTAPITLLFGPILSYNVIICFAFFSSATAMMLVASRWVKWLPAAFLAGLLYGFSSYMVGQGYGHLFLILTALFPIMFLVLDEILVRQQWRWWIPGGLLGLVIVAQLFLSPELLVDALTLAVFGASFLAIAYRQEIATRITYAVRSLLVTACVALPFAVWFAIVFLFGPGHVSGAIRDPAAVANLSTNVANLVVPSTNQYFNFGLAPWADSLINYADGLQQTSSFSENGAFLGIPLILLALGGLVVLWRRPFIRFIAFLTGVALVFSFGSRLRIGTLDTNIPMPFAALTHLPLFNSTIAIRWSLFVWFFVALITALTVEKARSIIMSASPGRVKVVLATSVSVLVLATVFTLLPPWPYLNGESNTPAWFTSTATLAVPVGSTLLTYPMADDHDAIPMMWQAVAGFRYRLVGGYAGPQTKQLGAVDAALLMCMHNPTLQEPPANLISATRIQFYVLQIDTIVVPNGFTTNQACGVKFLTDVTGRRPIQQEDAQVWTNLLGLHHR